MTEDTYLGNKTDTLSINRYLYGNANPLKYKDPQGLWSDEYIYRLRQQRIENGILSADVVAVTQIEEKSIARAVIEVATRTTRLIGVGYNAISDFIVPNRDIEQYSEYEFDKIGDYKDAINYTDEITNLLIREEMNYSDVRNSSYSIGIFSDIKSRAQRYADFYTKEKTNGRLDIKQNDKVWNAAFNNTAPYPNESKFVYDDIVIDKAELGNIVYGYWGKAMGFTDRELFYGGGVANKLNQNKAILSSSGNNLVASIIAYAKAGLNFSSILIDINYGDDAKDIAAIMKGIELYNKVNNYIVGCGGGIAGGSR